LGAGCDGRWRAQGAYFSELFPARIRYSGLSLVQQFGPILGGGLSPLIATALLAAYGSPFWVAVYMAAMALFSAACAHGLRPQHAE
jgi:MFS family permease